MVRRLVGFYEYANALSDLDELVELSTEQDLTAIDEILTDHHEFDVFLTLPNSFPPSDDVDFLTETNAVSGNELQRSGLQWVTALARVEYGARIAGFTDNPEPFKDVTYDTHDYDAVMQLLLEGVVGHHAALSENAMFSGKGSIRSKDQKIMNALTLSRRARIARAMLDPLLAPGKSAYNPIQVTELEQYDSELDEGQDLVNAQIRSFLAERGSASTSLASSEFVRACGLQLSAERRELAAGTATVRNYPPE